MRFVKQQQLNTKNVSDSSVSAKANGHIVLDTTYALRVPTGSTSQRPEFPENGQIRYNTDLNEFEVYVNNSWEINRTNRPATITIQNLGAGDAVETQFGPLSPIPSTAANVLVLVENVVQIADVNYTLYQGGQNEYYIQFDSAVPLGKDVTVIHGFD